METSLISGPTEGGPPNAGIPQPEGSRGGAFETLLLELGLLPATSDPPHNGSSESPAAAAGEDLGSSRGVTADVTSGQDGQGEISSSRSGVLGPFGDLFIVTHVSLCTEKPAGDPDSLETENAKGDSETSESDDVWPATPAPGPVEVPITLAALAITTQGGQPPTASSQETSSLPSIDMSRPASGLSGASPEQVQSKLPEPVSSAINNASTPDPGGSIVGWHADESSEVQTFTEALPTTSPKSVPGIDPFIGGPDDAPAEVGSLSAIPMSMDGEGAVSSHEHGGHQPDVQVGLQLKTPPETQSGETFQVAAPPAFARGERPAGGLLRPEGPVSVNPPAAPPSPSSVYFEVQPPDAGRVRVHLALSDQTIYARVVTEQSEVQEFLLRNVGRLETQLQSYGLDVGRFHVEVDRQDQGRSQNAWTFSAQDPIAPRTSVAEEPASEDTRHEPAWQPHRVNVFA